MSEKPVLIFVYGTLRRNCSSGANYRLLHNATFLGTASLQAKLFRVSSYPAITLTHENFFVLGEVYALENEQQLHLLDEYEECPLPWHPEQEYRREMVAVVTQEGSNSLNAWAYLYNRPTGALEQIMSGDFLAERLAHEALISSNNT